MYFFNSISNIALLLLTVTAKVTPTAVIVSSPSSVPAGASQYVDHALGSFSIAVHFFQDYAGNLSSPNTFSRNLIQVLANKTGKAPYIRVGGTSSDHTRYIANQTTSILTQKIGAAAIAYDIPSAVSVGPTWFEGFLNFPGSKFHFDLSLAINGSAGLANCLAEASVAMKYIGPNLESFEIGNEVDLYTYLGFRDSNYTEAAYVAEWLAHAEAISSQVLAGNDYGFDNWNPFQALTYLSDGTLALTGNPAFANKFSVISAFNQSNINRDGRVKSVSLHAYQTMAGPNLRLQNDYMNHTAIAGNLSQHIPTIQWLKKNTNTTFVLGETNSNSNNLFVSQYAGVFGSALWVCDYLLYAMAINVTRVYLHQGTTFGYAGWVPVPYGGLAPQVKAPFYGNLLVADVIGKSPTVQVVPVDTGMWNMSAYATYEAGNLAKYIVINFDTWNSTTPYPRPVQEISLKVPSNVAGAKVEILTAAGASADSGITWAGMSYNYSTNGLGLQVKSDTKLVAAANGVVNVTVQSTEAIVVTLITTNTSPQASTTAMPTAIPTGGAESLLKSSPRALTWGMLLAFAVAFYL